MKVFMNLVFCATLFSCGNSALMGPVGKVTIQSIYDCEDRYTNDKFSMSFETRTINEQGTKALFGTLNTTVPVDEHFGYEFDMIRWDNSGWKPALNRKSNFCVDWVIYTKDFAAKFGKAMEPNMPPACPIPPGSYELKNFQVSTRDFATPIFYYGKMKVTVKILIDDEVVGCAAGEGHSQSII